jgi:hypothetical protein
LSGTPTAPSWENIHGLRASEIAALTNDAVYLAATIREFQQQLDEKKAAIMDLLVRAKTDTVQVGETRVTRVAGRAGSTKIDPVLLLKAGVKESIISQATVKGKDGEPYIKLTTKVDE